MQVLFHQGILHGSQAFQETSSVPCLLSRMECPPEYSHAPVTVLGVTQASQRFQSCCGSRNQLCAGQASPSKFSMRDICSTLCLLHSQLPATASQYSGPWEHLLGPDPGSSYKWSQQHMVDGESCFLSSTHGAFSALA